MNSRIFVGKVRHRRFIKVSHEFNYKLFMLYLDLDELSSLFKDYWFWSSQGFNIASFKRKKYLGDVNESLRASVETLLGLVPEKIFLLTNLAYYGYCFNPISIYFCFNNQVMTHCIAEVTNTPWNEQHVYILKPKKIKNTIYSMEFKKQLHVSPFLTMDYSYALKCKHTSENIVVHIENWQKDACHFDATLTLTAQPINHTNLAKILLRFPFMTGKVIAGIYWQSLKLYWKNVPIIAHKEKGHEKNTRH